MWKFVISLCLLLAATALGAEPLYPPMKPPLTDLVRNGQAHCVIIPDPGTGRAGQWAAEQLRIYLRKISGADVPVGKAASDGNIPIYIRRDSALAEERLRMRCDGKEVVLVGGGERGILYAATAFLEECLGVRWFMPTDYGEVIPHSPTVQVGRFDRTEQPDFALRWVGADPDWAAHNRLNVALPLADTKMAFPGHSFNKILPPEKYFKEHPDWFAYRRETNERRPTQWCTSNPDLFLEVVKNMRATLDADPEVRIIGLCPNDGLDFCECDACMKLDEPGRPSVVEINSKYLQFPDEQRRGALTRRMLLLYNRVAKALRESHPKVIVRSFAYNAYLAPPADLTLKCEPNLMVQICHNTCNNHPFGEGNCPLNALFRAYLDGWASLCERIGFYEYYLKGASMGLPWPLVHSIRADIPYLKAHGGWGFYTQWRSANLPASGLNYYVAAKLLWNTRLNVDALLDDYFQKSFGPAADPMRRIFERLEDAAAQSPLHSKGSSDCKYVFVREWYAPRVLDPCFDDLAEARRKTTDSDILRRIGVQEALLTFARLMCRYGEELARLHGKGALADKDSLEEARRRAEEVRAFVKARSADGLILTRNAEHYLNPISALKRMGAPIASLW